MKPYSYIKGGELMGASRLIEVVESRLKEFLVAALADAEVDEAFYRRTNADVDAKIRQGELTSARDHYITAGYFEDRLPRPVAVDEAFYCDQYPDVAEAIRRGAFTSGAEHFAQSGFKEGRLPRAGWSLHRER